MKILYQAENGKIFEDEDKCYNYEYALKFPEMFNIHFYDIDGSEYMIDEKDIFHDRVYWEAEKVNIHNETELAVLHKLALDCGWCEFDQITAPGIWVRKENDNIIEGKWERYEEN